LGGWGVGLPVWLPLSGALCCLPGQRDTVGLRRVLQLHPTPLALPTSWRAAACHPIPHPTPHPLPARSMYDPDEIEEEQAEREKRNKINAEFNNFVKRVQVRQTALATAGRRPAALRAAAARAAPGARPLPLPPARTAAAHPATGTPAAVSPPTPSGPSPHV
jgi:hypothetical protein